jgi:pimeloyl-ACP methyl ester carboxylesterase
MRGFAFTLAHAGYTIVLWDFDGHGANPQPMASDPHSGSLVTNAKAALAEAQARGLADPGRVAVLGHSMGSGVALAFGQAHPETNATIAVSPVRQPVTSASPRNLLLLAGSLETPFVRNAEQLLEQAGGPGGDPSVGTGRRMAIVQDVEHVSILFAPAAHEAAREWLDGTFGPQPGATAYTDRRVMWYGIGLVGALLVSTGLAPLIAGLSARTPEHSLTRPRALPRRLAPLAGGVLCATLVLWGASVAGLELSNLLGLLIGGYVVVWFGIAGLFAHLLLRVRPSMPTRRDVLVGLFAFAVLWVSVGLLGQWVWLQWLLIPRRLLLWPLGILLTLPWFLAVGEAARGGSTAGWLGWWLYHSAVLAGGFLLALRLSPELSFIVLVLPLLPIVLGIHALTTAPYRERWPFAISGALFVSWLFLAVFPLG